MASRESAAPRRRSWGLKQPATPPTATVDDYQPVGAASGEDDRFRPARLNQVEAQERRLLSRPWRRGNPSGTARLLDRLLLAVEIVCALVLAGLVWQYLYTVYLDTAPRRVSPATQPVGAYSRATLQPSLTPTPTKSLEKPTATRVRVIEVAPPLVGEMPLGERGTNRVQVSPTPSPTATPGVPTALRLPARLRIPAMFLDSPVHEVTVNLGEWEVSPMDIGHHEGTANPGERGNVVLAGHRDINSALFRELDRLEPGDEVFVGNGVREYRYVVKESLVVQPNHIEVMEATSDSRVTLITCTPIGLATQRLVVVAVLDE